MPKDIFDDILARPVAKNTNRVASHRIDIDIEAATPLLTLCSAPGDKAGATPPRATVGVIGDTALGMALEAGTIANGRFDAAIVCREQEVGQPIILILRDRVSNLGTFRAELGLQREFLFFFEAARGDGAFEVVLLTNMSKTRLTFKIDPETILKAVGFSMRTHVFGMAPR